jgi:type IV fimbrial biogenesis protein FimT
MRQGSGHRLHRGFTLVELLVVVTIAMLLARWSLAAFTEMRRNAEITAVSNAMLGILETGRDLALARRARVVLCPSIDSQHCQERWTDDLILFFDIDGNGRHDDGEELVQVALRLPAHTFLALASFRRKPYMAWEANGQSYASNGTFTLCNEERQAQRLRQFVISRAGRVRLRQPEQQGARALQAAEAACNW